MTYPLIFTHYGYQPYLDYTLNQAKKTNQNRRLIILGDKDNRDIAVRCGWEHYNFEIYTSALHHRFNAAFTPIFGPANRPHFSKFPEAEKIYLKWLRFVTERWFFIDSFIHEHNLSRFWHFDSDTMILRDLDYFEKELKEFDFTSQCNNACLNGLINADVSAEFCSFICGIYEDRSFVAEQQLMLEASGTDHAFTEMAAFGIFRSISTRNNTWLMDIGGRYIFDDCLCQDHGFQTTSAPFGRSVKRIRFHQKAAYGLKSNRWIEFITLNLSWLPTYAFQWVSDAQNGRACADIHWLKENDGFARVGYCQQNYGSILLTNSYDFIRDTISATLKAAHKSVRKRLVKFHEHSETNWKHRSSAALTIGNDLFDVVESWDLNGIKKSNLGNTTTFTCGRDKKSEDFFWKVYSISRALESSDDGDLVVYCEAPFDASKVSEMSIYALISWLSEDQSRLAVCHQGAPNSQFTKRDCFHLLDCDSDRYWSYCHFESGLLGFIASDKTRHLIRQWLQSCADERICSSDASVCGLAELSNFVEHKHASSILSTLIVKNQFVAPVLRVGSQIESCTIDNVLNYFEQESIKAHIINGEYCLSIGKEWSASSGSEWSATSGKMFAFNDHVDFFFHTNFQEDPWWIIDLEETRELSTIMIVNRLTVPFGERARRLKVHIGSESAKLSLIFDGAAANWDPYKTLVLSLMGRFARFVRISIDGAAILHLKDVMIFCGPNSKDDSFLLPIR